MTLPTEDEYYILPTVNKRVSVAWLCTTLQWRVWSPLCSTQNVLALPDNSQVAKSLHRVVAAIRVESFNLCVPLTPLRPPVTSVRPTVDCTGYAVGIVKSKLLNFSNTVSKVW